MLYYRVWHRGFLHVWFPIFTTFKGLSIIIDYPDFGRYIFYFCAHEFFPQPTQVGFRKLHKNDLLQQEYRDALYVEYPLIIQLSAH